jgi:hypothetical protein
MDDPRLDDPQGLDASRRQDRGFGGAAIGDTVQSQAGGGQCDRQGKASAEEASPAPAAEIPAEGLLQLGR